MNNSLQRLIDGMIATLRNDVIPHVEDDFGRGQALGVIDLLNNLAPRIDWAREPLAEAVAARRAVMQKVALLLGRPAQKQSAGDWTALSPVELAAERDRLDGEISDCLAELWDGGSQDASEAVALIKAHVHEQLTRDMQMTRKPLFAEIAKGSGGKA